jgi:hypothetical protein
MHFQFKANSLAPVADIGKIEPAAIAREPADQIANESQRADDFVEGEG